MHLCISKCNNGQCRQQPNSRTAESNDRTARGRKPMPLRRQSNLSYNYENERRTSHKQDLKSWALFFEKKNTENKIRDRVWYSCLVWLRVGSMYVHSFVYAKAMRYWKCAFPCIKLRAGWVSACSCSIQIKLKISVNICVTFEICNGH